MGEVMNGKDRYAEAFLKAHKEQEAKKPTDVDSVVDRAEMKLFFASKEINNGGLRDDKR